MNATGTIQSIQPILGSREEPKKGARVKLIEYERLEVLFDGDFTGHAHINNFKPGACKIGGTVTLTFEEEQVKDLT